MGQVAKSLLHALVWILPPQDDSKKAIRRWRYGVFVSLFGLLLAVAFLGGLAFNKIPGFDGFARASAVQSVSMEVADVKIQLLDDRLLKMRERQCRAIAEGNTAAMKFAAENMRDLRNEYREITGVEWRTPECEELI